MSIQFKKLSDDAFIPTKGTEYSAGFDLYATETVNVIGGEGIFPIPTKIAVQLPLGTYGRIAMRSGLAKNQHLSLSAGVIDLDFNGELLIMVYCTKIGYSYTIKKGERFCQLVVEKAFYGNSTEVKEFSRNLKEHGGFGSTGKF